jgi:hypothetical protein
MTLEVPPPPLMLHIYICIWWMDQLGANRTAEFKSTVFPFPLSSAFMYGRYVLKQIFHMYCRLCCHTWVRYLMYYIPCSMYIHLVLWVFGTRYLYVLLPWSDYCTCTVSVHVKPVHNFYWFNRYLKVLTSVGFRRCIHTAFILYITVYSSLL